MISIISSHVLLISLKEYSKSHKIKSSHLLRKEKTILLNKKISHKDNPHQENLYRLKINKSKTS